MKIILILSIFREQSWKKILEVHFQLSKIFFFCFIVYFTIIYYNILYVYIYTAPTQYRVLPLVKDRLLLLLKVNAGSVSFLLSYIMLYKKKVMKSRIIFD